VTIVSSYHNFSCACDLFFADECEIIVGKTSHQAISHRVKSITMSNWTMDEVNELTDQRCGGNNAALHIWLQNSPPIGQR